MKRKYAVLGWPVQHSLSPAMQQAAFDACGIEAVYEAWPVAPEKLGEGIEKLKADGYEGWNVTVPHKHGITDYLSEIDPPAAVAGSVNTVINHDGYLKGYSTDGYGLEKAAEEAFGRKPQDGAVGFIGAGGAANAAALHLAVQGTPRIVILNRTVAKAQHLAEAIRKLEPSCEVVYGGFEDDAFISSVLADCSLVVQATSLGLKEDDPAPVSPELVPHDADVYEMIYKRTAFLEKCRARGCRTTDGAGMLLHQGAGSFRLWTGLEPPVEQMRAALQAAVQKRQTS